MSLLQEGVECCQFLVLPAWLLFIIPVALQTGAVNSWCLLFIPIQYNSYNVTIDICHMWSISQGQTCVATKRTNILINHPQCLIAKDALVSSQGRNLPYGCAVLQHATPHLATIFERQWANISILCPQYTSTQCVQTATWLCAQHAPTPKIIMPKPSLHLCGCGVTCKHTGRRTQTSHSLCVRRVHLPFLLHVLLLLPEPGHLVLQHHEMLPCVTIADSLLLLQTLQRTGRLCMLLSELIHLHKTTGSMPVASNRCSYIYQCVNSYAGWGIESIMTA